MKHTIILFVILLFGACSSNTAELESPFKYKESANKDSLIAAEKLDSLQYIADKKLDSLKNIVENYLAEDVRPDSTIVTVWSMDTNKQGSYIRLNDKEIFVRKLTTKELNHQGIDDSLTKTIVRGWKKEKGK